ncbi:cell wall metabolism sensor histidine kinase WalK [Oscillibacter sp.]|jgi:signal transduction histidine kinase|uniref:sensor histidine kinase n=1 Tax=Oscillibacter sp. TaxID=1945593 RepID=UPI002172E161|nr:HAMP domain-containing sensor histidine kinase [Oscillibacter sp.]MCI9649686.1 HAMP domain-containing histidine kinase [Oscillibacter sp.]
MKLFWKLFCSMVLITTLACDVGGYVLIDTQFRASLEREVSALYEENDLLRYALAQELAFHPLYSRRELAAAAKGISISTSRGTVAFRLSGETGETLGGSGQLPVEAGPLTASLPQGRRGWVMDALSDGRVYLHAASPLVLEDGILYLENCREVSGLFQDRSEQYRSFFTLVLVLTGAVGALSLAVAAMLLRPLGRLSAATRRMAEGELDQRVAVRGDDEIALLSADFNVMSHRIQRQVQELRDAARRQEDFIGSFAHEIKTPLTSMIGYADLLRSRPATEEQVRQSAGYIFSEGRRLEALSRKLLDLVVLDRQDFPLRPVPLDVFLGRVAGAMAPALEQAGVRLTVRAQPVPALMEPDLMETVCLNLLDNARKAMEGGGDLLLEGLSEEGRPVIRVTDSGKGIPAEELERVTEAFYMVDKSRSRAQGGAGLGLALCRRIVDLHGGTLELESTPGQGTRVTVRLKGGKT